MSVDLARLLPPVFQGEAKSAVVALSPLRYDARRKQLLLAKRLLVRLLFTARETGESGRGSRGRRQRPEPEAKVTGEVLARLYTQGRGLYAVSFEQLFPGRSRGLAASQLRLERQGEARGFHLEPATGHVRPRRRPLLPCRHAGDVYGLLLGGGVGAPRGARRSADAARAGGPLRGGWSRRHRKARRPSRWTASTSRGCWTPPDLWLWEALASGATRVKSFTLTGVDAASAQASQLEVLLQGASESGNPVDHHVSVSRERRAGGGGAVRGEGCRTG